MASNKSVIVLAPNGRRQTVKVNPNTTILQILEEVCKKQGYKPEEYDIKHHNNILDVSSILRFTGLPNNAQLEMCTIQRAREENPVTLGIQLESGERLTGCFVPNENLWNILKEICPKEIETEQNAVVIYMRQEIYGNALKSTSLKSLGLTGGRAMLRLIHRRPEELKIQANVSNPLPSKPAEEKPYYKKPQSLSNFAEKPAPATATRDKAPNDSKDTNKPSKKDNFLTNFIKKEKDKRNSDSKPSKSKRDEPMELDAQKESGKEVDLLDGITFLGERNALAFSLNSAQTVPHEDLPDEFFELTIQDAKKLLRDLKQKRLELEENPLQTSQLRKLEESKKTLRLLNQYTRTVIRVQFPDRAVLQGTFKPTETVADVMDFVRKYLHDPATDFHLYTTPPKCTLDSNKSLLDTGCVPSVILHFGVPGPVSEHDKFLSHALYSSFTSPAAAGVAATKSRGKERAPKKEEYDDVEMTDYSQPSQSARAAAYDSEPSTSKNKGSADGPEKKLPKWFKPSK